MFLFTTRCQHFFCKTLHAQQNSSVGLKGAVQRFGLFSDLSSAQLSLEFLLFVRTLVATVAIRNFPDHWEMKQKNMPSLTKVAGIKQQVLLHGNLSLESSQSRCIQKPDIIVSLPPMIYAIPHMPSKS